MPAPLLLLVDDEPAMHVLGRLLARRAGCSLDCAADARAAAQALALRRPDLLLLDLNLPGQDGASWLAALREAGDALPVALFVQSSLAEDVARGWDAGADYLFAKELVGDPSAWQARLEEILAHLDGRDGPASIACPSATELLARLPAPLALSVLCRAERGDSLTNQATRLLGPALSWPPVPRTSAPATGGQIR